MYAERCSKVNGVKCLHVAFLRAVSVNSPGNPWSQYWRRKRRLCCKETVGEGLQNRSVSDCDAVPPVLIAEQLFEDVLTVTSAHTDRWTSATRTTKHSWWPHWDGIRRVQTVDSEGLIVVGLISEGQCVRLSGSTPFSRIPFRFLLQTLCKASSFVISLLYL